MQSGGPFVIAKSNLEQPSWESLGESKGEKERISLA